MGLRRGELLGPRWDDADLECGTLRVGRALVREGGRHILGETKTKRGRRRVNLTPRTVDALKAHRKRQLEERMKLAGLLRGPGTYLRHPYGYARQSREPGEALLQTTTQEGQPTGDTIS